VDNSNSYYCTEDVAILRTREITGGQDEVTQGYTIRHVPLSFSINPSGKRQRAPQRLLTLCLQHCATACRAGRPFHKLDHRPGI